MYVPRPLAFHNQASSLGMPYADMTTARFGQFAQLQCESEGICIWNLAHQGRAVTKKDTNLGMRTAELVIHI